MAASFRSASSSVSSDCTSGSGAAAPPVSVRSSSSTRYAVSATIAQCVGRFWSMVDFLLIVLHRFTPEGLSASTEHRRTKCYFCFGSAMALAAAADLFLNVYAWRVDT
jgi:hypothetical protein